MMDAVGFEHALHAPGSPVAAAQGTDVCPIVGVYLVDVAWKCLFVFVLVNRGCAWFFRSWVCCSALLAWVIPLRLSVYRVVISGRLALCQVNRTIDRWLDELPAVRRLTTACDASHREMVGLHVILNSKGALRPDANVSDKEIRPEADRRQLDGGRHLPACRD